MCGPVTAEVTQVSCSPLVLTDFQDAGVPDWFFRWFFAGERK